MSAGRILTDQTKVEQKSTEKIILMKITIIQGDVYDITNEKNGKRYVGVTYIGFDEKNSVVRFSCPEELGKTHQVYDLEHKFNPDLCEEIKLKRKIFGDKITYTEV